MEISYRVVVFFFLTPLSPQVRLPRGEQLRATDDIDMRHRHDPRPVWSVPPSYLLRQRGDRRPPAPDPAPLRRVCRASFGHTESELSTRL
jgi:hypothetical protein